MDLMNQICKTCLDHFVVVFIDDILGYSKTLEEQAQHLKTILEVLRKDKLYSKLKKCEFWLEKVAFLGHIVSKEGLSVDPQKVEAVTNWPTPKNATEVRSFLGLVGYYWRFAQDISKMATPLTNLTRKTLKYEWMEKCEQAFQELKKRLTSAPILALPSGNEGLMVYNDASHNGLRHVFARWDGL